MKIPTALFLLAATAATLTASAFADNPQLQNSLAIERAKAEQNRQAPTVAVQVRGRGIGERVTTTRETEERSFVRHLGRGQDQVIKVNPRE